jgi:hypothetical protein
MEITLETTITAFAIISLAVFSNQIFQSILSQERE